MQSRIDGSRISKGEFKINASSASQVMSVPKFQPGFRFSAIDFVVLVAVAVVSVILWQQLMWVGFVVAFVIGHFFLFCNVFRLSRPLELGWSALFVAVAAGTVVADIPGWPFAITSSLLTTGIVIAIEVRKPSYHGICWQHINPGLRKWWEEHTGSLSRRST